MRNDYGLVASAKPGSSPINRGRDKKHKIEDNLRKLLAVSY